VDVDFVIDARQEAEVRNLMKEQGYVNQSSHGNVLFCNKPGDALRIDFLKTDSDTMKQLWDHKRPFVLQGASAGYLISLEHLVAMKLVALRENFERRRSKDLADVLNLARHHGWEYTRDMKPLVEQFGNAQIERELLRTWEDPA
jgi:hypothetical protein